MNGRNADGGKGGKATAISVGKQSVTEAIPEPTEAEREVADLLSIGADPARAQAVLDEVPIWFHTFCLDQGSLYTPGIARDHRYRIPYFPEDLGGRRVLDVGTFDGFYAFLAEARGAARVVAIDNQQYVDWVRSRFGIEPRGGEGFRAIAGLLDSKVVHMRLDAYDLDSLHEDFNLILCFGAIHRVRDPLGLLDLMRRRLAPGGEVLLETHGVRDRQLEDGAAIHVCEAGEPYSREDFVYWGFSGTSLDRLARLAGFVGARVHDRPIVDGRPRIICTLHT